MKVVTFLDMLSVVASRVIIVVLSGVALYRMIIKMEPLRFDGGDLSYLPEIWKRWIFDEKPKSKKL